MLSVARSATITRGAMFLVLFLFLSSCYEQLSSTARLKMKREREVCRKDNNSRRRRSETNGDIKDDGGGTRPVHGIHGFYGVIKANGVIAYIIDRWICVVIAYDLFARK